MQGPLKIGFNMKQIAKILLTIPVLCLLCFIFILFGFLEDHWAVIFIQLIGVFGLMFFVPILMYLFIALLIQKPALIISEAGIQDNSQLYGAGFIRWDEIKELSTGDSHTVYYLVIKLHDPSLLIKRANVFKRLYLRTGQYISSSAAQIDVSRLDISGVELVKQIEHYSAGKFKDRDIPDEDVDKWLV